MELEAGLREELLRSRVDAAGVRPSTCLGTTFTVELGILDDPVADLLRIQNEHGVGQGALLREQRSRLEVQGSEGSDPFQNLDPVGTSLRRHGEVSDRLGQRVDPTQRAVAAEGELLGAAIGEDPLEHCLEPLPSAVRVDPQLPSVVRVEVEVVHVPRGVGRDEVSDPASRPLRLSAIASILSRDPEQVGLLLLHRMELKSLTLRLLVLIVGAQLGLPCSSGDAQRGPEDLRVVRDLRRIVRHRAGHGRTFLVHVADDDDRVTVRESAAVSGIVVIFQKLHGEVRARSILRHRSDLGDKVKSGVGRVPHHDSMPSTEVLRIREGHFDVEGVSSRASTRIGHTQASIGVLPRRGNLLRRERLRPPVHNCYTFI